MTQFENAGGGVRGNPAPRRIALAAIAALAVAGCNTDKLIAVKEPDVVTTPELQGKGSLPSLLGGAISNFQVAFSGSSGL